MSYIFSCLLHYRAGMDPKLWMAANNSNKKPEDSDDCIQMLLECLLMLCTRRLIREELRKKKYSESFGMLQNVDNLDVWRVWEVWKHWKA